MSTTYFLRATYVLNLGYDFKHCEPPPALLPRFVFFMVAFTLGIAPVFGGFEELSYKQQA